MMNNNDNRAAQPARNPDSGAAAPSADAPHDDPCDCDQCRESVQPDVWDHDFVRTGHSAHNCGVCEVYHGYHGNKGEPRGTSQSAAGAPSTGWRDGVYLGDGEYLNRTPTAPRQTAGWTDPWPGYDMVNLARVQQCDTCGALVLQDAMIRHTDWHLSTS